MKDLQRLVLFLVIDATMLLAFVGVAALAIGTLDNSKLEPRVIPDEARPDELVEISADAWDRSGWDCRLTVVDSSGSAEGYANPGQVIGARVVWAYRIPESANRGDATATIYCASAWDGLFDTSESTHFEIVDE